MNIYLKLFLTFLEIGAVSFGGGYGMLAIIREKCLENQWLTEEGLMNFIAIAESTPGPIAVNMATFVGSSQGGIAGALLSTLGVILPSFFIILIIASVVSNLMKYAGVTAAINGVKPVIAGLIISTAATMFLSVVFGIVRIGIASSIDFKSAFIFLFVTAIGILSKKLRKKAVSPILLILISAIFGIAFFGL